MPQQLTQVFQAVRAEPFAQRVDRFHKPHRHRGIARIAHGAGGMAGRERQRGQAQRQRDRQAGKPGRPKGGADTGMRAVLALLEKTYQK